MELVQITKQVPKESKDIVDAVEMLLDLVLKKAPIEEYASLLPKVMAAVENVSAVKSELKSSHRNELVSHLLLVLLEKLWSDEPEFKEESAQVIEQADLG